MSGDLLVGRLLDLPSYLAAAAGRGATRDAYDDGSVWLYRVEQPGAIIQYRQQEATMMRLCDRHLFAPPSLLLVLESLVIS